jgi:membrane fusion protein (multidrug efflux system)
MPGSRAALRNRGYWQSACIAYRVPRTGDVDHGTDGVEQEQLNEPAPPPERPVRKHRLLRWVMIIGAIVVAAGFWFWWHGRNRESTDDATVDGHIVPISPRISGRILQVLVNDNQHVEQGQPLVTLDPSVYETRVQQAQAALDAAIAKANAAQVTVPLTRATTSTGTTGAAANLVTAQAEATAAQVAAQRAATSEVSAAEANVAQAEANNRKAQADLDRMRQLVARQEISKLQYDAYVAAARVASAQLNAARQQLNAARQSAEDARANAQAAASKVAQARAALQQSKANQQQVGVSAAEAKSAQAAIEQARANLQAAQLDLSYTTIPASVTGQVTDKHAEPGQVVQPGQELLSLVPLHNVWVTANFKETQLAHVRPGDRAEVHVDTYGKTIAGRVNSIAGATGSITSLLPPENATGNFVKVVQRIPVKIVFDRLPPGIVLRPGMNVEATIITD